MNTGFLPGAPNKVEPNPKDDDWEPPNPPEHLNHLGRSAWFRIWSAGAEYIDEDIDFLLVEEYCELYQETQRMRQELELGKAGGGVDRREMINAGKTPARHQYVQDIKDNRTVMNSILAQLGFTPAARSRMKVEREITNQALETLRDIQQGRGVFKKADQ